VPVIYAMGTVDPSGRVLAQSIVRALGWAADDLLTITAAPGVVIMRRDPRGVFTIPATSHLHIPAPLRARHHLRGGDRVLLTAALAHDTVLIYTMAMLHQALAEQQHALLEGDPR
jgi:hypothetical protein